MDYQGGTEVASILHPTRGGESSYPNQDRAISLANERNDRLILLYVSDVRFLDTIASPVPVDLVEEQLDELGEFMLAMAQERAEKAGVATEMIVRHGSFQQALKEVIEEYEVDTIILGSPADKSAVTTTDYVQNLIQFLQAEREVEVIIVHAGQIVERQRAPG
jgi:nucleotide-binding universal stress UspA family protein